LLAQKESIMALQFNRLEFDTKARRRLEKLRLERKAKAHLSSI
jgi:hypothetical protein